MRGTETGVGRRDEDRAQFDRRHVTARVRKSPVYYIYLSGQATSPVTC